MASKDQISSEELFDQFKELTLLELSEFVKLFEDTFEVTAASPTPVVAAATPGTKYAEEIGELDVVLESGGDKKIGVIKVVREVVSGLGLKEAKDLVESAPTVLLRNAKRSDALEAHSKLTSAGGKVILPASLKDESSNPSIASHRPRYQTGTKVAAPETGTGATRNNPAAADVLHKYIELLGNRAFAASHLGVSADQLIPETFVPNHNQIVQIARTGAVGAAFSKYWNITLFADWLQTPNGHLNLNQPKNLINIGQIENVIGAIEADAFGSYA
jgi:large subunit ribosomal protein L7/L12